MAKHIVSISVQVTVDANSPYEAQKIAWANAKALLADKSASITSATHVREEK